MKTIVLKNFAWLLATVIFSSCTQTLSPSSADLFKTPRDTRKWNDYVSIPSGLIGTTESQDTNCIEKIKQVVCLVDPTLDMSTARKCLPESPNYHEKVLQAYGTLPPLFQKMFCSLRVIWVEKELTSLAYAGNGTDSNGHRVNVLGVRASVFDDDIQLPTMLSWKEQKLFGIDKAPFELDAQGPKFQLSGPALPNSGLYYALLHELGHLFDFANDLNDMTGISSEWSRLSWASGDSILQGSPLEIFKNQICFYDCASRLSINQRADFYNRLEKSNFLTSYAATSSFEDFAESTAFYFFKNHFQQEVSIQVPTVNHIIPLSQKMQQQIFKAKLDFVQDFYSSNPTVEKAIQAH